MVTGCIVLLYISYSIPVAALLIKGRDNIKHGPFWLGKFGLFANSVLLAWTLFTLVMFSMPFAKPVLASSKLFLVEYFTTSLTTCPLIFDSIYPCLNHPVHSFAPSHSLYTHILHPCVLSRHPDKSSGPISNTYLFCRHELRLGSLRCRVRLCAHLLGHSGETYISD